MAGPQGPKGDKGDTGTAGAPGPQGIQGPKGDKGDQGPAGIIEIAKNQNGLAIKYENGWMECIRTSELTPESMSVWGSGYCSEFISIGNYAVPFKQLYGVEIALHSSYYWPLKAKETATSFGGFYFVSFANVKYKTYYCARAYGYWK